MSEIHNKQQHEALLEKQNETQTTDKQLSRKRKVENTSGVSKNGEEILVTQNKHAKKSRSTDITGSCKNQDNILEDQGSTEQKRDSQKSKHSETKCCQKRCINVVDSQVRHRLNQEYKRQLNQSREHGRSYLRRYFYPYKNSETFSDGTSKNVMFQFRIPPKVPFDDGDKKIEICQRAFMKIFELRDIWEPWHIKVEYGKLMKSR